MRDVVLNFGQNGNDAQNDANDHIEGDEELVQFTVSSLSTSIVYVENDNGGQ